MPDARQTVDRWFSIRLGVSVADVKPGQVTVATSERRTYCERSYGFIRLLWVAHFGDRAAVSVHPAVLSEVSRLAWRVKPDDVMTDDFSAQVGAALQSALSGTEASVGYITLHFYHPGDAPSVPTDGEVRPTTPAHKGKWAGERVYQSAADHPSALRGEAFGLFLGDRLIAEVITHDPPVAEMADLIAADGIEVSERYRGQGYGKALLAAWTRKMQGRGRVCVHSTSADNAASIALARSLGYLEYARTRTVSYHPPEGK